MSEQTSQNSERLLSFMAGIAARDDMDPQEVTAAWANSEYIGYSSYGADPIEFSEDDIAVIRKLLAEYVFADRVGC